MEFSLDDGQLELQQTVARFCADRFPLEDLVAREGRPLDRDVWRELAELGVFSILLDEESGGLGVVEAALLFEQLGSYLVPGPVLWTALAAGLVEGAATGAAVVAGVETGVVAGARSFDGVVIEHPDDLDVLVVVHGDAVVRLDQSDLPPAERLEPFDPLTPVARLRELPAGEPVADATGAARLRLLGTVLSAAMLVGAASRALEVARTYALEREQFGVPIGSFQAVKHMLADMYVAAGIAQSAVYAAAAVAQDPGDDDPGRAAGAAKLLAADAATTNAGTAVQVLGGMGFTWEMLPNHLLKRAWVLEQCFGTGASHARDLGAALAGDRA